jgi:hypothetical protein
VKRNGDPLRAVTFSTLASALERIDYGTDGTKTLALMLLHKP